MWRCTIFGELCAANEFMEFRSFDAGHSREPEALPSQFEYLRRDWHFLGKLFGLLVVLLNIRIGRFFEVLQGS